MRVRDFAEEVFVPVNFRTKRAYHPGAFATITWELLREIMRGNADIHDATGLNKR